MKNRGGTTLEIRVHITSRERSYVSLLCFPSQKVSVYFAIIRSFAQKFYLPRSGFVFRRQLCKDRKGI